MAAGLPLTNEVTVNDRLKFRVGRIVWLAFSRDQREMGLAFPKNERLALVAGEPDVFLMPRATDLRYNWIEIRLESLDHDRMTTLVHQAWRMVVPNSVAANHFRA
ncbi:MAG: MmcQ/YjbR family DNA-binding protein [Brachybacterium paraconglomeratum]|nr:MmcQ/YjbR family DNA-binding protein [Brachybacterium paraconglomeratum]